MRDEACHSLNQHYSESPSVVGVIDLPSSLKSLISLLALIWLRVEVPQTGPVSSRPITLAPSPLSTLLIQIAPSG